MAKYRVSVVVEYDYDVEVESAEIAEDMGWRFEDYTYFATVRQIDVEEYDEDDGDCDE
jgi:hypothetical protein